MGTIEYLGTIEYPADANVVIGEDGRAKIEPQTCTCNPSDNPPVPCPRKFALTECRVAALVAAALPFAAHDWMDAELEDDSCKLTTHSGGVTVGHWRALRNALAALSAGG